MLIDWFTVIAQAVNFLILVWLLKRFLYQPILDALDARERRIAEALNNATAKEVEAEKERREFQQKNEALDQQRAQLLLKASDEARAERQRIIDAARKDAEEIHAKYMRAMKQEYHGLSQTIARLTSEEILAITKKVLADLAATTLESYTVEVFVKRLRELGEVEKAEFASAAQRVESSSESVRIDEKVMPAITVRSAFDLSLPQQEEIRSVLEETLSTNPAIRFSIDPELIIGLDLILGDYKIAWSAKDYLASLEKEISSVIRAHFQEEVT